MLRRLACLWDYLLRRRRLEDDLDEELRSSFEMIVDQFVARGMPLSAARRAARIEFEGLDQVKEQVRDGLVGSALSAVLQDVRYAWRGLLRRPSFAIVALVTLALGIGVNTAVFSVFYAVLLRPLPYRDPDRLALIWTSLRAAGTPRATVSGPMLAEIARRNRSLAGVAGIWVGTGTFTGDNPEQVKVAQVTSNFFDVLGVRAAHGRTFTKEEDAGGRSAIVLTDGFFRRRFAANTALIGQGLPTQDSAATLLGVLPPDFQLQFAPDANVPSDVQAFAPFVSDIYQGPRKLYYIRLVARLKPGVSLPQAQQDLDRVAAEIRGAYTEFAAEDVHFTLAGMHADANRDVAPALAALFAGAAFVLLICCVNVTSLLLARANDRRKEIALRLAVGASRGRILRQLLAEGGVLCLLLRRQHSAGAGPRRQCQRNTRQPASERERFRNSESVQLDSRPTPQQGIGQNISCYGNAGAGNLIALPNTRTFNSDVTLSKVFPLRNERRQIRFSAEAYNVFNHTQFTAANITPSYSWPLWQTGILQQTNANLGRYTTAANPRQMSMSLRFQF